MPNVRACGELQLPLETRLALREALEAIVWDGLPRGGVGHVCTPARPHARIGVERSHSNAHLRRMIRVTAEEMCPAFATEAFLETAVGMPPGLYQLVPLQQPERAPVDAGLRRRRSPCATLATSAVAIAGGPGGLSELEADATAEAAAGQ